MHGVFFFVYVCVWFGVCAVDRRWRALFKSVSGIEFQWSVYCLSPSMDLWFGVDWWICVAYVIGMTSDFTKQRCFDDYKVLIFEVLVWDIMQVVVTATFNHHRLHSAPFQHKPRIQLSWQRSSSMALMETATATMMCITSWVSMKKVALIVYGTHEIATTAMMME